MIDHTKIIRLKPFQIIGISVRTSNQNDHSQKDIGALWARFTKDNLQDQIPGKLSSDMYCVYTNYETDYNGPYTVVIGCKVKSIDELPHGFTGITIPEGRYQENILTGKFPENVHAAWQKIWNSNIERRYTADYDLYSAGAKSFEDTEVKIYLAVG